MANTSWYNNNTAYHGSRNMNGNYNSSLNTYNTNYQYPANTHNPAHITSPLSPRVNQTTTNYSNIPVHHQQQLNTNQQDYYIPTSHVTPAVGVGFNPSYYIPILHYNLSDTITKKQYVGPEVLYKYTEESPESSAAVSPSISDYQGFNNSNNYQAGVGNQYNYSPGIIGTTTSGYLQQHCDCGSYHGQW